MQNTNNQLAQYYRMLLSGGGSPVSLPQVNQQPNLLLKQLARLFQQPEAGDGFNFNVPMPPLAGFMGVNQPRQVVNNRLY